MKNLLKVLTSTAASLSLITTVAVADKFVCKGYTATVKKIGKKIYFDDKEAEEFRMMMVKKNNTISTIMLDTFTVENFKLVKNNSKNNIFKYDSISDPGSHLLVVPVLEEKKFLITFVDDEADTYITDICVKMKGN